MRTVIFGSGERGQQAYGPVSEQAVVVGFVDNDPSRQHTTVLDRPVFPPSTLPLLDLDCVYVASSQVDAIRRQLGEQYGFHGARVRLVPGLTDPETYAEPAQENQLAGYVEKGFHEIAGWLHQAALDATLLLAEIQKGLVSPGPVCEIGVWEGRYLTLLSFVPETPQRVLGIDPFIHGGDRESQLRRVRSNVSRYARRPDLVTLLERDSRTVAPEVITGLLGAPCQFVSVDGDHTLEGALCDLRLAQTITAPRGIVAVDDIPNFACPGVTEAVVRYAMEPTSTLAPFLLVSNKLFLTQREHCEDYRREILRRAERGEAGEWGVRVLNHRNRMGALNVPVRFVGEELLVAT